MKRIRLAIVDDSIFIRKAVQRLLEGEPSLLIVGTASTGEELIENWDKWSPDIVTLDLSMPGMGGLQTLDWIHSTTRTPVIILSTHSSKAAPLTIEALHRGAVDFIDKEQYSLVDFASLRAVLLEKIVQIAGVKKSRTPRLPSLPATALPQIPSHDFDVLLIGASTGGPPAIQRVLEGIGKQLVVPTVIVQHMPVGFTKAFAERLNKHLPFSVREAADGDLLTAGRAYISKTGRHLTFSRDPVSSASNGRGAVRVRYVLEPEDAQHRPSVDELFRSGADVFGERVLSVLLTGMGKDGALGMAELHRAGSYTLTQDEASCVVYGMPKAAVGLGVSCEAVPLDEIGERVRALLRPNQTAAPTTP